MSQGAQIDYDALAKQAGAISSQPPQQGGAVDYDALAKQAGAISSTPPAVAHPSTYQRLTAPIDPGTEAFAEKHPVLGVPARFLSSAGAAAMGLPGSIYHAFTDPLTPEEEQNFQGHTRIPGEVILERLTGAEGAPQALSDWLSKKVTPRAALSVTPELAGQATGTAAAAGAAGEAASGAISAAKTGLQKAALLGKTPAEAYQSALKPSTTLSEAERARVVQTGLEEQIPVSKKGLQKIDALVSDLNKKIQAQIDAGTASGVSVDPNKVALRANSLRSRFANQVNPNADLTSIEAAKKEFLENNPQPLTAAQAQSMKQGTYQQLSSKAYGEMGSATIEAQKALARGLKEELAEQFPEIKDLNARESQLYNLEPLLERAVNRIGNHQLAGIGTPIAAGAAKAVSGSGTVGAVAGLLKLVLDDPALKSRLAIAISRKGTLPYSSAAARVASYQASLGSAAQVRQTQANDDTLNPRTSGTP